MSFDAGLESLVRRDRAVTLGGLLALAALAWLYLLRLGHETAEMAAMGMARTAPWTAADAVLAAAMWAVMMVAMMLPSAAPMILLFAAADRRRRGAGGAPPVDTAAFVTGYLLVWGAFSLAAAAAQWALQRAALLSGDATALAPAAGAGVVLAAGIYQLTPLKDACLARCRTPIGFLVTEWRDGRGGAFVMGLRHGLFCVGCCWMLMALLFAGGVMNLAWAAAIAAVVLAEKVVPGGRWISWGTGAALVVGAAWLLGTALA